jgi:hypothetical protein
MMRLYGREVAVRLIRNGYLVQWQDNGVHEQHCKDMHEVSELLEDIFLRMREKENVREQKQNSS